MKLKWLLILLFPLTIYSQKPPCSCNFQTIVSGGIVAGKSPVKPLFQAGGGVNIKQFYAGVGGGLDLYRFKSIPLFADLRFSFGKTKFGFLYANSGYNIPFDNENEDEWGDFWQTTNRFEGGFYMDVGIGYRIPLGASNRLLISSGFSHKRINNIVGYTFPCLLPPCIEEFDTYRYNLGRIVAKLSWEFGKFK